MASLSQGRTAAAQCGLFTYKSVPVIFEPPFTYTSMSRKEGTIERSRPSLRHCPGICLEYMIKIIRYLSQGSLALSHVMNLNISEYEGDLSLTVFITVKFCSLFYFPLLVISLL